MRIFLAVGLAVSSLTACQQRPEPDIETIFEYRCVELEVTAIITEEDRVNLILIDRQLSLPLTPVTSGVRFADDRENVFWTKGPDEAMLTLAGDATRNCGRIAGS